MVSSTFKYSYIHQPKVTTFAFSSVFILLLWWEGTECKMSAYGGLNNWNNSNTTAQYSLYCYYLKIMFFGKFSLFRQVHSTGTCKNCFTKSWFFAAFSGSIFRGFVVLFFAYFDFLSDIKRVQYLIVNIFTEQTMLFYLKIFLLLFRNTI